ncbi:WAT1-related At2g37460-like [Olea europaea subsp. europaea]|uniref:WAT1-related protein n=1 Tax=Olea europaea subsp. europaea TaxID=158383 RepID=A0A8S0S0J1_OLEEU|nr:WAT1-related At2g37460-like [Olea europaea subsp. europaea]
MDKITKLRIKFFFSRVLTLPLNVYVCLHVPYRVLFYTYKHVRLRLFVSNQTQVLFYRKVRPRMTLLTFGKLMLMSLLEPVIDQNLYFLGMKYTTATFASAMANVLPAITFLMACFFRLEKVQLMSIRSQAKIVGTIATVAGAMIMTLVRGPDIGLPWTHGRSSHENQNNGVTLKHSIKGSIMITIGCFSWACFMILQAVTLKTYPAELSLTAWICLFGTIEGALVAVAVERGNTAVWSIGWDYKLLAAVYSGIFCSGIAYYVQGLVMKERGPVFVTAFSPLSMVVVAIISSFILAEKMYLGRLFGAIVIVLGLYFVVWGKKNDHKSPAMKEQEIPVKQMVNITDDGTINGHSICEVTIDEVRREGAVAGVERLNNKN